MELTKILLLTSLATLIPGQIIRIPLGAGALTLTDLSVFTTVVIFVFTHLIRGTKVYLPKNILLTALAFILVALASNILALNAFSLSQVITSSFFLIRFIFYLLVIVVVVNTISKKEIQNWLNITLIFGSIFALLGLVQLILFPDLSSLTIYGWDPHLNRLVSTLIDPNFSGALLAIFLAISLSLYIFLKKQIYLILAVLFIASIVLTFSRSSYLALAVLLLIIGFAKSPKIFAISLIFLTITFFVNSRVQERIIGALTLDETAQARIQSWQNAHTVFRQNLLIGAGFNTYRYAQTKYGKVPTVSPQDSHSGAGSDSSILLVAATTGIIGLSAFLFLVITIIKHLVKGTKKNYLKLAALSSFLAIIVHSQFVNSFFFPQIMLTLFFLIGLSYAKDN